MHHMIELPAWERLMKSIAWEQIGELRDLEILDFGSGLGVTADHFAAANRVTAVEPQGEGTPGQRWRDHPYREIMGDVSALSEFPDGCFDCVICHNVLEYIDEKAPVLRELCRVLKPGGTLSLIKHNRAGRVMQNAVLLDDLARANALLDGKDDASSKFGTIRYYEDSDVTAWCPELCPTHSLGIRTFWHLQQKQEGHASEEWQEEMKALELRVADLPEYRNIAFFHHLIYRKEG